MLTTVEAVQAKEIRALALQAAATVFSGQSFNITINGYHDAAHEVIGVANYFENYIETGEG